MPLLAEIVVTVFLLVGSAFVLVGGIGLVRLPDFFTRLHAPTKATTLGVGGMLIASIAYFFALETPTLHELLIALFLFLTAPVSALMLAKAGLHLRLKSRAPLPPRRG
ncbi:MAG TPA: Na+/H+ antiporter subunit G [Burkholderiales bacterium]|jgi:multicomponent K+:H+ antiporter subunit G|nr:Na+/H+ antiporter subunit G [Burkholderiales bacterium]